MELEKTQTESIKKFEALQTTVNSQIETLKQIEISDPTSLGVANQQLSAAKTLVNGIEEKRVELKAPFLDAGKKIDALAGNLSKPLESVMDSLKDKVLTYKKAEEAKRIAEIEKIAAEQKAIQQEEEIRQNMLAENMKKFAAAAFNGINNIKNESELSKAYTDFYVNYPVEYGEDLKAKIKALGSARYAELKNPIQSTIDFYHKLYCEYTGTEMVIEVPASEVMVDAKLEEKKAELEIQQAASSKGLRATWDFEVSNVTEVPKSWMIVDEKKVKEFIKEHKSELSEDIIINGIRFFQKKTVVIK